MEKERRKRIKILEKELKKVEKQERKLCRAAEKATDSRWKAALEEKVPQKVYFGLEAAFSKAFALIFKQGTGIIEKTYKKQEIQNDHAVLDYAVKLRGRKKELRQLQRKAKRADGWNMLATTAEGMALGVLGIGMPDIVLFLSTLLKGIYETSLHYGYDYNSKSEQYLILKMMAAALCKGEQWTLENRDVDAWLLEDSIAVEDAALESQMKAASSAFAVDMLLLKFIQGLPVVGILGGAANPVYYRRVMDYVSLKYRKRYLRQRLRELEG